MCLLGRSAPEQRPCVLRPGFFPFYLFYLIIILLCVQAFMLHSEWSDVSSSLQPCIAFALSSGQQTGQIGKCLYPARRAQSTLLWMSVAVVCLYLMSVCLSMHPVGTGTRASCSAGACGTFSPRAASHSHSG